MYVFGSAIYRPKDSCLETTYTVVEIVVTMSVECMHAVVGYLVRAERAGSENQDSNKESLSVM